MAGGAPPAGRGPDAHRVLRRHFSGGAGQLCHRQPLRLARDVCRWRSACPAAGVDSAWCERTGALAGESKCRSHFCFLAPPGGTVLAGIAPAHDSEFDLHARFDFRSVGGNGVRAVGDYGARRGFGTGRASSGATRFTRRDAGFLRDHSWLSHHAVAGGQGSAAAARSRSSFR